MNSLLLHTQQLQIGYPGHPLSSALEMKIPSPVRLGIIGGNGSGKTTLVKTLLGLLDPLAGGFQWEVGVTFGYVPQESQMDMIFPLTVLDLLKMGFHQALPRLGNTSEVFEESSQQVLQLFEISHLQNILFRELSGGQRQRALIARALIHYPKVLVMDEPHNSLDHNFREKLWNILERLQYKNNISWMVIDHDLNRIINQVNWLCLMGNKKTFYGPTEEILNEDILSEAYEEPVHVHQENNKYQVHFL
jgi:ABC-type Mn2+/Zn2+ transport system ATPase subunit